MAIRRVRDAVVVVRFRRCHNAIELSLRRSWHIPRRTLRRLRRAGIGRIVVILIVPASCVTSRVHRRIWQKTVSAGKAARAGERRIAHPIRTASRLLHTTRVQQIYRIPANVSIPIPTGGILRLGAGLERIHSIEPAIPGRIISLIRIIHPRKRTPRIRRELHPIARCPRDLIPVRIKPRPIRPVRPQPIRKIRSRRIRRPRPAPQQLPSEPYIRRLRVHFPPAIGRIVRIRALLPPPKRSQLLPARPVQRPLLRPVRRPLVYPMVARVVPVILRPARPHRRRRHPIRLVVRHRQPARTRIRHAQQIAICIIAHIRQHPRRVHQLIRRRVHRNRRRTFPR